MIADPPALCRGDDQSCVACCRGSGMSEHRLAAALRRQTALFGRPGSIPSYLSLVLHELRARRGLPLLLAPLFLLPGVGPLLRSWFINRTCCTFLGFPDSDMTRPGCLLHPSRWDGSDVRRRVAFALLPGMGCGEPGYVCLSAALYAAAGPGPRRQFRERTRALGWFAFSRAVEALERELLARPAAASSATRPG